MSLEGKIHFKEGMTPCEVTLDGKQYPVELHTSEGRKVEFVMVKGKKIERFEINVIVFLWENSLVD